ncbi:hypothetical protein E2562_012182, partial [Oryza meyeriana var. granulata]
VGDGVDKSERMEAWTLDIKEELDIVVSRLDAAHRGHMPPSLDSALPVLGMPWELCHIISKKGNTSSSGGSSGRLARGRGRKQAGWHRLGWRKQPRRRQASQTGGPGSSTEVWARPAAAWSRREHQQRRPRSSAAQARRLRALRPVAQAAVDARGRAPWAQERPRRLPRARAGHKA